MSGRIGRLDGRVVRAAVVVAVAAAAGSPLLAAGLREPATATPALAPGPTATATEGGGGEQHPTTPPPVALTDEKTACDRLFPAPWEPSPGWAQARLGYDTAHRYATGAGVKVAVIDTGVSIANPQLADAVVGGASFVTEDTVVATVDCDGHGSMAAGIIAARPHAASGLVGMAPGASILAYRYTAGGDKGSPAAAMALAIRRAVDDGARVINVSSVTETNLNDLRDAVVYAEQHDVLIVAAAGNAGDSSNAVTYPARYPGVMAVAAVDESGAWWPKSQTSVPISVSAPGVDVLGAAPISGNSVGEGTSFAAPYVAGLAALVMEKYPRLSAQQVKARIEATCDAPAGSVPDTKMGFGTINPTRALTEVVPEHTAGPGATAAAAEPMPPLPVPDRLDDAVRDRSLALAGSALGLAAIAVGTVASVRRARARR